MYTGKDTHVTHQRSHKGIALHKSQCKRGRKKIRLCVTFYTSPRATLQCPSSPPPSTFTFTAIMHRTSPSLIPNVHFPWRDSLYFSTRPSLTSPAIPGHKHSTFFTLCTGAYFTCVLDHVNFPYPSCGISAACLCNTGVPHGHTLRWSSSYLYLSSHISLSFSLLITTSVYTEIRCLWALFPRVLNTDSPPQDW